MWHRLRIEFDSDRILIENYPFEPASVCAHNRLSIGSIRGVNPLCTPPEVYLRIGEVIFLPSSHKMALVKFMEQNDLPIIKRVDTWALLLEPFLHAKIDDNQRKLTLEILEKNGVSEDEVEAIRAKVWDAMMAYNYESNLYEWVHLGLSDLLNAMQGQLSGDKYKLSSDEFKDFYKWAMEIAERGQALPTK